MDNATALGNGRIGIVLDTSKLPNFDSSSLNSDEAFFYVENAVKITARDLSKCDVYMKYGAVGTGTTLDQLGGTPDMIISDGTHTIKLDYKNDFTLSAKKDGVNVTAFNEAGTYELTLTAVAGGKAINSKTISLLVQDNIATTASSTKFGKNGENYGAEYNGKAYEPTKDDLGTIVVNGTTGESTLDTSSYQISGYSNNTDASVSGVFTAHVYIVPSTGAYEGQTVDIPFTIDPRTVKPADITVPETITYNEEYVKAEEYNVPITVVANDKNGKNPITLSSSDYTVSYAYVDGNDTGSTPSNALGDKIQATIQILNTNFIGAPSVKAAKTTEITNPALSENAIKINPSSYTYTGGVITPEFVVMDGLFILEEGEEYEVVGVTDATNVGTGKITVKGIGNYSGTASATFEITPADTSDVKVSIEKEQYKGSQIRPRKFTATLNGNDVTNQFEIVGYGENIKAGTGTVILAPKAGNENFTGGNITAEFTIYSEEIDGVVKVYDQYGIDITNKYEAEDQTAGETFTFDGTAKTFSKETFEITTADTKATVDDFEIKYVDNVSGKTVNGKSYNLAYVYVVAKDGSGYTGDEEIITADGTVIKDVVAKFAFGINSVKFVKRM